MKKTLLLTHEYYPFKGGIANYTYHLFKFFNHQDYLIVTDQQEVKGKNIINIKLISQFIKPSYLFSFFKLKKIIKKYKIAQIFTPHILPLGSLAYFLNIPYIISLRGLDNNLALKNRPHLTKKILEKAEKIIVNSKQTRERVKEYGQKVELIYPSIDLKKDYDFPKLEKLKKEIKGKEEIILLTVGRLTKRKAQDLVIKVLGELKDLNLKYYIIGQGEELENLNNLIKAENLNNVFILTNIDDNDLRYYYQLADIFVLPQRDKKEDQEGFGIVFLEAGSYGLAIIAGQEGGPREILTNNKNSLLITQDNLGELKEALLLLVFNKKKREELGRAIKKRVLEFSNAEEQSSKLKKILS